MFNSISPNKADILLLKTFKSNYEGCYNNQRKSDTNLNSGRNTMRQYSARSNNSTQSSHHSNNNQSSHHSSHHSNNNQSFHHSNNSHNNNYNDTPPQIKISIKKRMNKNNDNINIQPTKEYFNFIIERTNQGIYKLTSFVNKNKKEFGYARIDTIERQELLLDLFENTIDNNKANDIIVKCKYCKKFGKFIPIVKSTDTEPDQYIDVKQYVNSLGA